MDRQAQIEVLLDHFQHPRGHGKIDDASVVMPGGNPGCGDVVTVYLEADPSGDQIAKASFVGSGCTISQAAASVVMEMVNGNHDHGPMTFDQVLGLDYEDLIDTLGRETVATRPRCATLALGTLKAAIRRQQRNQVRKAHGLPPEPVPEGEETFLV